MTTQVMLLTGCASGIGQHLANVMAARGYCLMATDIHMDALQAHAQKMNWNLEHVIIRRLDVRDWDAWQTAISEVVAAWGRLDVLMNIAGHMQPAYIDAITPEQIDAHVDVNVKGVMYGTCAAAAQMIPQGGGHIINFVSLAGLAPISGLGAYSASKFAARGFSLVAAGELRKKGVAVTTICPDAVHTPMLDLQLEYEEAVMTFSGFKTLTVQDVERVVWHVLKKKPLEVSIPRYRGWLAKIGGLLPGLGLFAEPLLKWQGRANQKRLRRK